MTAKFIGRTIIAMLFLDQIASASVFNRLNPLIEGRGKEYPRKSLTQKLYIEILESSNMSPAMLNDARQSIVKHFTNIVPASGDESRDIAADMERKYGGYWAVYIYDSHYDIAFTTTRRASSYALIAADDRVVLLAKEGGGGQRRRMQKKRSR